MELMGKDLSARLLSTLKLPALRRETKLMSNIRRRTQKFGKFKIYSRQSTIYVEPVGDGCDLAGAYAACKQVFGLIAIARAPSAPLPKGGWHGEAVTGGFLTASHSL